MRHSLYQTELGEEAGTVTLRTNGSRAPQPVTDTTVHCTSEATSLQSRNLPHFLLDEDSTDIKAGRVSHSGCTDTSGSGHRYTLQYRCGDNYSTWRQGRGGTFHLIPAMREGLHDMYNWFTLRTSTEQKTR